MKRKSKLIISIILALIIALGGSFGYIWYTQNSPKAKLVKELQSLDNYNEEKKELYLSFLEQYPDANMDFVILQVNAGLENEAYSEDLVQLMHDSSADKDKFVRYYQYLTQNQISIDDCLFMVNHDIDLYSSQYDPSIKELVNQSDFDASKLERYIKLYHNQSTNISDTITLVNHDIDLIQRTDYDNILGFISQEYYIQKNLLRYLEYKERHPSVATKEIVTRVNSYLDYYFYSHDMDTKLEDGILLICNKFYRLSSDYVPENLVTISSAYSDSGARLEKTTCEAFEYMCKDALQYGQTIKAYGDNGYRSYSYQASLYNYYKNAYGTSGADECSARPGYSEHQTGLAIDVMVNGSKYNTNHQLDWLMENSWKYGFINRYTVANSYITGYIDEEWHYRYVGLEAATYIHEHNLSYEEYYAYFVCDNTITTEQFVAMFN